MRYRYFKQWRPRYSRRVIGCVITLVLNWALPMCLLAQSPNADEYEIRAAMLFNLTKFVTWPSWKADESHPDFLVCILGSDPLGPQLDSFLRNKTLGAKPIVVRHLTSIDAAYDCHILYVSATERKTVSRVYLALAKKSVLTVSERPNTDNTSQIVGLPSAEEHVRIVSTSVSRCGAG